MSYELRLALFVAAVFFGMLALLEGGRRMGRRHIAAGPKKFRSGLAAVDGAVFGLLGLLIAFTFSGAAERFDARRKLIVEEANAIDTAYHRLDVLEPADRAELRLQFRRYLDLRLSLYAVLEDERLAEQRLAEAAEIQEVIWARAVGALSSSKVAGAPVVLLPALNAMFDLSTERVAALRFHPPAIVFVMLAGLAFVCAALAGFGMAERQRPSLFHVLGFASIIAFTVLVILDLEFPRFGFIRVNPTDRWLIRVRDGMK